RSILRGLRIAVCSQRGRGMVSGVFVRNKVRKTAVGAKLDQMRSDWTGRWMYRGCASACTSIWEVFHEDGLLADMAPGRGGGRAAADGGGMCIRARGRGCR